MEITAQLDEETLRKLQQIQQQTNQDQAEILKDAITTYYNRLHDEQSIVEQPQSSQILKKAPFEGFQEIGLVGCIGSKPFRTRANSDRRSTRLQHLSLQHHPTL